MLCIPQCALWCQGGICHCNSHKRSNYWSNLRDSTMLGHLQAFNLTVSEMDEHLRRAGTTLWSLQGHLAHIMKAVVAYLNLSWSFVEKMLLIFKKEALVQFSIFLRGQSLMEYGSDAQHQIRLIHEWVTSSMTLALKVTRCHFSPNLPVMQLHTCVWTCVIVPEWSW